jgi:hypothetical protein
MTRTEAIKHFKSIPALAQALGISYEAVRQWGEEVPDLRQYQLECITNGVLKAAPKKNAA